MAYVSKDLTHFVGRAFDGGSDEGQEKQYEVLLRILRKGVIYYDPTEPNLAPLLDVAPNMRLCDDKMYRPPAVCFCDIPVRELGLHMRKYSRFGIAFTKPFLLDKGANPVFYVAADSMVWPMPRRGSGKEYTRERQMNGLLERYHAVRTKARAAVDEMLTPDPTLYGLLTDLEVVAKELDYYVFSFFKCFSASLPKKDSKHYYMEREWRVIGNLSFRLTDVRRIIVPTSYEQRLRNDLPSYTGTIRSVAART